MLHEFSAPNCTICMQECSYSEVTRDAGLVDKGCKEGQIQLPTDTPIYIVRHTF